jgi:hypothetical protein
MSESGDYTPADWGGHSYNDPRAFYDPTVGRGYATTKKTRKRATSSSSSTTSSGSTHVDLNNLLEKQVTTDSIAPLVIFSDVTGSMGAWPATMFAKLPFLDDQVKVYLGPEAKICFGAVGDAYSDSYPLQCRPFGIGPELIDRMKELYVEGNGGGQMCETYELAALYALHNINIPKAVRPVLIMIGDEKPYTSVSPDVAQEFAGVTLQAAITTEQIFSALMNKFEVFFIRKPYGSGSGSNSMSSEDKEVHARWVSILGTDRVVDLPQAERVVDVIFGILAKVAGRFDDFEAEINARQRPDQVKTVMTSLKTIHTPTRAAIAGGKSIMALPGGTDGSKTKTLLGPGATKLKGDN